MRKTVTRMGKIERMNFCSINSAKIFGATVQLKQFVVFICIYIYISLAVEFNLAKLKLTKIRSLIRRKFCILRSDLEKRRENSFLF